MGHHFRERDTHVKISRRTALRGMLSTGLVGALPVAAEATEEISDSQRLAECIAELERLAMRMHGSCSRVTNWVKTCEDGTFHIVIDGHRDYLPFTGDGVYTIALASGYLVTCELYETQRLNHRGEPLFTEYLSFHIDEEGIVSDDPRMVWEPKIVRKIGELV